MSACKDCSSKTGFAFVVLSVVRGTTPLCMYYSVYYLRSPALVVALKCAISLCLFVLSAALLLKRSAVRTTILSNVITRSTYWKLLYVGLLQSAAPYLLAVYAAQYVPITFVNVFMVTTPWWMFLSERFVHESDEKRVPVVLKVGIIVGVLGIIIMMIPIVLETALCAAHNKNTTNANSSSVSSNVSSKVASLDYCHSFTEVITGFIACMSAPLLRAIAAVFWKKNQGDIHYIVGGIGQNLFGGIIASLIWYVVGKVTIFKPIAWNPKWWIGCILYLGVATGWIGTFLIRYLYIRLGSKVIHQVLIGLPIITFIEDCLLIRDMLSIHSYTLVVELFGLVVLTAGVFISNVPYDDTDGGRPEYDSENKEITERLLSPSSGHHNQGMDGDCHQTLRNQAEQYRGHIDYDVYDSPKAH